MSTTETQSLPPLVSLLSSTAVTTYASPIKISIPVQITFRPSYVGQIQFRRNSEVTCRNLAIYLIYELLYMANLFPPDLVRFCA